MPTKLGNAQTTPYFLSATRNTHHDNEGCVNHGRHRLVLPHRPEKPDPPGDRLKTRNSLDPSTLRLGPSQRGSRPPPRATLIANRSPTYLTGTATEPPRSALSIPTTSSGTNHPHTPTCTPRLRRTRSTRMTHLANRSPRTSQPASYHALTLRRSPRFEGAPPPTHSAPCATLHHATRLLPAPSS